MKFKQNLLILSAILIAILILAIGCQPTPTAPPVEGDVPSGGSVSIAHGAAATNDATPLLTISATGADYMAFGGNGITWSSWVAYATSYTLFNITTGAGCTTGEGTKTVYVKFKNDAGESITYNDTIEYDITKPKLSTAVYSDAKSRGSGTVNKGDIIAFTFNDEMDTSTITSSNVGSRLPLSAGNYGTGPTVSWNVAGTVCTVTLGTSPTIVSGTTVNPSSSVTDIAGNADNSSAITISGLLNVLASVSIAPSSAATTAGGATVTLTATALNTAGGNITSLCTFTWTISSIGTISPTTGSSTVYTPPLSGTGTDTITVTVVKTGTTTPTKTATATITVGTTTPTVDPAKLFVSAQTATAKYTALPPGATSVTVYSHATPDPVAAVTAGVKATIVLNDWWTTMAGIVANDHIYFMISYSDGTTSPVTYDGQLPDAPNVAALANIQATSKNTVTSTDAGNVVATDKISLYVAGARKSDPTPVGSTMTFVYNLAAGDAPTYTRTNVNGHESAVSVPDGQILELFSAADANGGGSLNVLDTGDTLTLGFTGGLSVDVTANITVSHISWVTTGAALLGTGTLAGIGTGTTVVLIATATCADFTGAETVTFNISDTVPIVDTAGGNQVLPRATGFIFTGGASF